MLHFLEILDNINLDDNNFGDCDPETINHVRLMAWYNRFKQHKACEKKKKKKIDEELLPVAWYATRVWDWNMSEG